MKNENYESWDVYHLIQPYFFPHYHFYKRKVIALKESGLKTRLITFVDNKKYKDNVVKYSKVEKEEEIIEIIKIKNNYLIHFSLLFFVIKKLMKGRSLVFHVLKFNANSLFLIKFIPVLNKRIKIIYEFEGDSASEFIYTKESFDCSVNTRESIDFKYRIKYRLKIMFDFIKVIFSDALILMSQEHINLWENRTGKKIESFILPTLPEKNRIFYSLSAREEIRKDLELENKTVLIYTGNVSCKWQRLDDMCCFFRELESKLGNIVFLFLVREDDLCIAREAIKKHKIEKFTVLRSVFSSDVYKYISASDIAVFFRHNHVMNNVVTSGKLGEYLAGGLPIISTGANALSLNEYMKNKNIFIGIDESLKVTDEMLLVLSDVLKKLQLAEDRDKLSESFYSAFNMDLILGEEYPNLIKRVIS